MCHGCWTALDYEFSSGRPLVIRRKLAATERGAYATDATADLGSARRRGHPKHRPKQRRHGELAHKNGKAPNHEPQGLTGEGRRVFRVGSASDNPADGVVSLKPAALMNQSCPEFLAQTGVPGVITTSPTVCHTETGN